MSRPGTLRRCLGTVLAGAALAGGWGAAPASAEPMFLSKQYPRCTACHYSPSGGGLLTSYGRSLSREEISTFGRRGAAGASSTEASRSEESFLFGALGSDSPCSSASTFGPRTWTWTCPAAPWTLATS